MAGGGELSGLRFFAGIRTETVEKVWRAGQVREVRRGQVLLRARETTEELLFQLAGKSFVYTLTHEGQRKISFILGPGVLLNQNTVRGSVCASYVEALEPGRVFAIATEAFEGCMQEDFALTRALVASQEWKLWRLEHQLKNTVSGLYMERKLSAKLWKLARDFGIPTRRGVEIDVDFSVGFLADMLGTPRETASRLRKTLVQYGFLAVDRRRITVLDPEGMARFYKTGIPPRQTGDGPVPK